MEQSNFFAVKGLQEIRTVKARIIQRRLLLQLRRYVQNSVADAIEVVCRR